MVNWRHFFSLDYTHGILLSNNNAKRSTVGELLSVTICIVDRIRLSHGRFFYSARRPKERSRPVADCEGKAQRSSHPAPTGRRFSLQIRLKSSAHGRGRRS